MRNPHRTIDVGLVAPGEVHWRHLTNPEMDAVQSALVGANWIRVKEGRLQVAGAFEEPPSPERDEHVGPFWYHWPYGSKQVKIFNEYHGYYEASLMIQGLGACCGKQSYRNAAENLESYGFECLRSRRGGDGKFWEVWFLPSLTLAEDELGAVVGSSTQGLQMGTDGWGKARVEAAVTFLCRSVHFGSLDVAIQRAALTFD